MSSFRTTRGAAALLVAALAAAGCSDSTAPTIDYIDTQAASAKVAPVIEVLSEPALAAFGGIASVEGLPQSAASAAAVTAVGRLTATAARGSWDRSTPLLARSAGRAAADVIPADARNKTYVWNPTGGTSGTGAYEVSTTRTDWPQDGIRVVLYAWDFLAGEPSLPLTEIGHVDLIDESTSVENRLHVVVVRGTGSSTTTLMDYDIRHTVTTSSESFTIVGTATDGTTPVEFNLTGLANETTVSLNFDLEAPTVGFNVHAGISANSMTQQATIETSLGYDGHTLSFEMTIHENGMEGEIRFDNLRYATLTVTVVETPNSVTTTTTFVKANGQPMTQQEAEDIGEIFATALELDAFWLGLLWPVGALAPAGI